MTDQPTTQERCPTCGSMTRSVFNAACYAHGWHDPWHGSQDVEGAAPASQTGRASGTVTAGIDAAPSTTQEADKALETLADARGDYLTGMEQQVYRRKTIDRLIGEFDDALRSLRTQHAKDQERIERLGKEYERAVRAYENLWKQVYE